MLKIAVTEIGHWFKKLSKQCFFVLVSTKIKTELYCFAVNSVFRFWRAEVPKVILIDFFIFNVMNAKVRINTE